MKRLSFILIITALMASCSNNDKASSVAETRQANKTALIDADIAFSRMSAVKGMKNAFIEYIDSNGVLLRANRLPIVGANAIDYLLQEDDTTYTLTWEPHFAEAASSGDLGYTYGIYQLHVKAKDTNLYGTYVSIWKKQRDGKWKFVLDTGNEGVGEE